MGEISSGKSEQLASLLGVESLSVKQEDALDRACGFSQYDNEVVLALLLLGCVDCDPCCKSEVAEVAVAEVAETADIAADYEQ